MQEQEIVESIGKTVVASDAYNGSYLGVLKGRLAPQYGLRAKVKILVNIELPSQRAELFPDIPANRPMYIAGSIENFNMNNVQFYTGQVKEGIALEDVLKDIVLKALEAKLGRAVSISQNEWDNARKDTLNDVYANRFCFFANVSSDYFINTMVDVLAVAKRISAA